MKKYDNLKLILFFIILTGVVTAIVIFTWEKVFMLPFYDWVASYYPGDRNARYFFEQRIEHFFISTTVDVIVVTLLLRIVSRQQRRLASSEERYRALFEHASDGIGVIHASDNRLIEVNNKFCEILSCQPKALINKNIHDLLHAEGNGSRAEPPTHLLGDSPPPSEGELMIRTAAGNSIPVSVSSNKISTVGEHLVILIIHDLSERKRFEAEKEEIQLQLFQSSKLASIGELSAGVAHEINNPLNGMINYAQLLKDDEVARTDSQRQILEGIIAEGGRIAKIVRDLLTFARQDPHELAPTNVAETINASMSLFGHQFEKDGVSIEIDVEEGLPPVMADGSRLRQVLVNLISNAHHALQVKRSGEKVFRVTGRADRRVVGGRQMVRIEFYDSGMGIRREDIGKVFDPFFTTRRANGGTGLGLSLSFGIIREYGGTITVESEEGRHTRFVVALPAAISREVEHEST